PFETATVGFVGASDPLTDLADGDLDRVYASTGDETGNLMLGGRLRTLRAGESLSRDFVIGFGASPTAASSAANATFSTGLDEVLARFNGEGERVGWEDYIAS